MKKIGIFLVCIMLVTSLFVFYPIQNVKADLTTGLVGYWSFDKGNAEDESGNGRNGIVYGASIVEGKSGNAFIFDGDDDYIDLGDDPDFDITGDITITLWFKTDTPQLGFMVSNLDNINPDNGYDLAIGYTFSVNPGETINFRLASNSNGPSGYDSAQTVSSFTDGLWHFLTAIYTPNGVSRPKIYIDTVEQSLSYYGIPLSSIGASPGYHLKIAEYSPSSGYFNFNGTLDEIRIYNRALSLQEIQYLYNNPGGVDTVYVDDDYNSLTPGWQIDHFGNIQEGIDAVVEHGVVYVYNGTYCENVVVNKAVNMVGENRDNTIVDGGNSDDTLRITVNYVNITRISFTNSSYAAWSNGGLEIVSASNCNIINCSFYNNGYAGIRLYDVHDTNFSECKVYDNYGEGIFMEYSSNILITNCTLHNICGTIRVDHYSNYVDIVDCIAYEGGSFLLLQGANNNIITRCVSYNNSYGVSMIGGWENNPPWGNKIFNCTLYDNYIGIRLNSAHDNFIFNNSIYNNEFGVNIIGESSSNHFFHNTFINNTQQANDPFSNIWDDGYPSGGNYWDDYTGIDYYHGPNQDILGSDSIGDEPYYISNGNNKDRYPLMKPWTPTPPVLEISIDIKPGSYPNSINPKDKGNVPVAILTTEDFNAGMVNSSTVIFLGVNPVKSALEDVDNDGDLDMILQFKTKQLNFTLLVDEGGEYPYAYLTGETISGELIEGKDTVRLIGQTSYSIIDWINQHFLILRQIFQRFPFFEKILNQYYN